MEIQKLIWQKQRTDLINQKDQGLSMCIPGQCDRRWAVVWAVESAPITTDLGRIAGEKHYPPPVILPKIVALDSTS